MIFWMALSLDNLGNKLLDIVTAGIFIISLVYAAQVVGIIFLNMIHSDIQKDLLSGFSIGFPILFSFIILLSIISSLSIFISSSVLIIIFTASSFFINFDYKKINISDLLGILFVGFSITLLLVPRINSLVSDGSNLIFRLWGDEFVLSSLMSNMAHANSITDIQSPNAYGIEMGIYHYGAYILGATVRSLSNIAPLDSMRAITAPFWLLYFGITLVFSGRLLGFSRLTPYLMASIVLVMPDAYQIGFGNNYLGWHFNLLISPSIISGVSIATLSLIFLSKYFNERKKSDLILSLLLNILIIFYKVHFIIFLWPAYLTACIWLLIQNRYNIYIKAIYSFCFIVVFYSLIVELSKFSSKFPLINFKYDGYKYFYKILILTQDDNLFSNIIENFIINGGNILSFISFNTYILFFGFGYTLFSIIMPIDKSNKSIFYLKKLILFILSIYIMSASFFSLDSRAIGTPDELLHRPFILVYTLLAFLFIVEIFSSINNISRNFKNTCVTTLLIISYSFGFIGSASGVSYTIDSKQSFQVEQCALDAMQWINQHKKIRGVAEADTYSMTQLLSGITGLTPYYIPRGSLSLYYPDLVENYEKHLIYIKNFFNNSHFTNALNLDPIDLYMTKISGPYPENFINLDSKYFKCEGSYSYIIVYKKNIM